MATFQKRGKNWRAIIRKDVYRDDPKTATFKTKREAEAWALQIESELSAGTHQKPTTRTLREAIIRYRDEEAVKHRGSFEEISRLNKFIDRLPIIDYALTDIEPDHLISIRDNRLKDTRLKNKATQTYVTVSPSTVRREMNLLRAVFEAARVEWRWIKINPYTDVTRPAESKPRSRRWRSDELLRLMDWLGYEDDGEIETLSQQAMAVALLAVETAMRRSEIALLDWARVDLESKLVYLDDTKNDEPRYVPLSPDALDIFSRIPRRDDTDRVFSIERTYVSKRIAKGLKALGIANLRLHDTRHEGSTRLASVLKNPMDLAKVTGHKDLNTLIKVYYNPDMSAIADVLGDHHETKKKKLAATAAKLDGTVE